MKKILSLLILVPLMAISQTIPADATALENIQITNNVTSLTAPFVTVQETNGVINKINKADLVNVVEVNDVPSLPLIGEIGKIYVVSNVNKIYRWNGTFYSEIFGAKGDKGDQGIQGIQGLKGDTGAKGDTGSFNGDITADQVTETATRKFQTPTQSAYNDANSPIQGQLNSKENAFSKNTAFNKNFGTTAGTVVEGGTLGSNAYSSTAYLPLSGGTVTGNLNVTGNIGIGTATPSRKFDIVVSTNSSTDVFGFSNSISGGLFGVDEINKYVYLKLNTGSGYGMDFRNYLGNSSLKFSDLGAATFASSVTAPTFNGSATLTGTPTAPTAALGTNTTQIATTAFVQSNTRPYKVYTALLSQSGTNAPVATVLENTLGGTVVWARSTDGIYYATSGYRFTDNKTTVFINNHRQDSNVAIECTNNNNVSVSTYGTSTVPFSGVDGRLLNNAIEIRVYL